MGCHEIKEKTSIIKIQGIEDSGRDLTQVQSLCIIWMPLGPLLDTQGSDFYFASPRILGILDNIEKSVHFEG